MSQDNGTPPPAGDMAQTGRFSDAALANAIADALRTNCPDLLQQCIQHQAAALERLVVEIEAARRFGVGFFADCVEEATRDHYRAAARAALQPQPQPHSQEA